MGLFGKAIEEPYVLSDTPTGALLVVSADGQAVASEQAMAVLEALRNKAMLELEIEAGVER